MLAGINLGEASLAYLLVYDELTYGVAANGLRPSG
jgi:hypothetical protein